MTDVTGEPLALWIAVYAAAVATASAGAQVYVAIQDRAKVRVEASQSVVPQASPDDDGLRISVEVVNCGRRPVTITGAGLILEVPKGESNSMQFVCGMTPGGNRLEENELAAFFGKPDRETYRRIKCAGARDATGREYRGPCRWKQR